jgi:hypothetical protein
MLQFKSPFSAAAAAKSALFWNDRISSPYELQNSKTGLAMRAARAILDPGVLAGSAPGSLPPAFLDAAFAFALA